ncbi:MAG: T9SS type A sorting domain-containing protein [Bacteroidales bacterium]|nr:T9SS type A sorting domain-containing protein [Bacteroidales bacterium]
MKNKIYLLTFIFIAALSVNSYGQARKYVLFEHFTNTGCGPCAQQNPIFQKNILDKNQGKIYHIAYHTYWPDNGDPMYQYNTSQSTDRVLYYFVKGVPNIRMQGNRYNGGPAGVTQSMLDDAASEPSPVRIKVTETPHDTSRSVRVVVYTLDTIPAGNYRMRVAVVENPKIYAVAPGGNLEKYFPDVFRKMLPNSAGDTCNFAPIGDSIVFNYSYNLDTLNWDTSKVFAVAFVQNIDTKDVLNAASQNTTSIELFANGKTFYSSNAGVAKTFYGKVENTGKTSYDCRLIFTKKQEANWVAGLTVDTTTVTDSTDITINGDSVKNITLVVTPGSTAGLGEYQIKMKCLSDTSIKYQMLKFYLISDVTDLIINNAGDWGDGSTTSAADFESNYVKGLTLAGNTTFAKTSSQIFMLANRSNALTNVKYLYFNVGWSFMSFTDENVPVFKSFLDNGGCLFVSGQDIGWEVNDPNGMGTNITKTFYSNYLNTTWNSDGAPANNLLTAVSGDVIFGSVSNSSIIDIYGGYMYPDEFTPKGIGLAAFTYNNNAAKTACVRSNNGTYKVVYLGVSLEMIADSNVRKQIIKLSHDWFHGLISVAEHKKSTTVQGIGQNYPNPCDENTVFPLYNLIDNVTLQINDLTGRVIYEKQVSKGTSTVEIYTSKIAEGVYMYRIFDAQRNYNAGLMQVVH